MQHNLNVLHDAPAMLTVCDTHELASVNRGPLAMGLLTGKYGPDSRLPMDDVRGDSPPWMTFFEDGRPASDFLAMLDAIRDILTSGGRTLAQGALAWLWARSPRTVPIPGFRSVAQVEENAGALGKGALNGEQMAEVERILGR